MIKILQRHSKFGKRKKWEDHESGWITHDINERKEWVYDLVVW
jgi:hypothetical protein